MQNLLNTKGIEETIQFIENQHQYLDQTKKELEDYLQFTKEGKFDLSTEGTIKEQIKRYESVLDKYEEISKRRVEITKKSETLKKNMEEMMNKVEMEGERKNAFAFLSADCIYIADRRRNFMLT